MILQTLAALAFAQPSGDLIASGQTLDGWRAIAATGVSHALALDKPEAALRLDFNYNQHGGFVLLERDFERVMPANYEFRFWVKAKSLDNNLEFKLSDDGGQTVWWHQQAAYRWPKEWAEVVIRKRNIWFAWGARERPLAKCTSLQIGIAANEGGQGQVWIKNLSFRELPSFGTPQDDHLESAGPVKTIAYGRPVEFGGIELDWKAAAPKNVRISWLDSATGTEVKQSVTGKGPGKQVVFTPRATAERVTIDPAPARAKLLPLEVSESRVGMMNAVAAATVRGYFPRTLLGEQCYWTIVGANGQREKGLLSEDGQVELGHAKPLIDPFVLIDGKPQENDLRVPTETKLRQGWIPMPSVVRKGDVELKVESFATNRTDSQLITLYTLKNTTKAVKSGSLVLAVRPVQVNPVWQSLGTRGGVAEIETIRSTASGFLLNGNTQVDFLQAAKTVCATTFEQGEIGQTIARGEWPTTQQVTCNQLLASGAAAFPFRLKPGQSVTLGWRSLLHGKGLPVPTLSQAKSLGDQTERSWSRLLGDIGITLPSSRFVDILRSNLAYMLINRDGVHIQPGSRNYARSWIRDGALMGAALLHFGRTQEVKDFLKWYEPFVQPDGYVPCIVDKRGADMTRESDSHGEYIFLVAETLRYSGDLALARHSFPTVERVMNYIIRSLDENKAEGYRGLIQPSISHEGYPIPKHSYWDNFFTLKGMNDAVELAERLGHADLAAQWRARTDQFRRDFFASIDRTVQEHKINYIPGCAELGDFDATSTSIALSPAGELPNLPAPLVQATFDKYWQFCLDRISLKDKWVAYTPYELRSLSSFIRLGQPERAWAILDFFTRDVRPRGWNHWAEVVYREVRAPKYIGDMPHTWCGAEFVRSFRDFFVYEEPAKQSLVLAAGIPPSWYEKAGFAVRKLPTPYGAVSLYGTAKPGHRFVVQVSQVGRVPGGVQVAGPRGVPKRVRVNGKEVPPQRLVAITGPCQVEFVYAAQ